MRAALVLVALVGVGGAAGSVWHRQGRSPTLPRLVSATARLVAVAIAPTDVTSLGAAARDLLAAGSVRHTIVTPSARAGSQPGTHNRRLTWWRQE